MRDAGGQRRGRLAAGALTLGALGLFATAGLLARTPPAPSQLEREPLAQRLLVPRTAPPAVLRDASAPAAPHPSAAMPTEILGSATAAVTTSAGGRDRRHGALTRPARPAPARRTHPQRAVPVRITIPAIGLSAAVIPLGINDDGTLAVPDDFDQTGWFVDGPEPGEDGPAVIVGHVDSRGGPAVFYRLRALLAGDIVDVALQDRSSVRFVVESALAAPKDRFPTRLVYGPTSTPELRLITCDGQFDRSTGHYRDNYIVFASLAAPD